MRWWLERKKRDHQGCCWWDFDFAVIPVDIIIVIRYVVDQPRFSTTCHEVIKLAKTLFFSCCMWCYKRMLIGWIRPKSGVGKVREQMKFFEWRCGTGWTFLIGLHSKRPWHPWVLQILLSHSAYTFARPNSLERQPLSQSSQTILLLGFDRWPWEFLWPK